MSKKIRELALTAPVILNFKTWEKYNKITNSEILDYQLINLLVIGEYLDFDINTINNLIIQDDLIISDDTVYITFPISEAYKFLLYADNPNLLESDIDTMIDVYDNDELISKLHNIITDASKISLFDTVNKGIYIVIERNI